MASSEAFRPITTVQEPGIQGMPRWYASTREVPAEWEPPVRGSVVGSILGPRYKTHIVVDASVSPKSGKLIASVVHCAPSAWVKLLGSEDRLSTIDNWLYERQVVPTPTQAAIEADPFSSYQPIDEAKSVRITKKPRRKKTDGTYEDGYPVKQRKSKGVDNLTPAKYRGQITTVETTTTEPLAAADVNDIPDPEDPTGDTTKIVHEKLNDEQYARSITDEIIEENADPLVGEEYGDIVTKSVEERLVEEGTAADTGILVTESTVDPLGNGKAVKRTKRVKGGAWPDPVEQQTGKEPNSPPAKYRDYVQRTTKTRKVGSIPPTVSLSGTEVGKTYKRETPDRIEETIIEETINLNVDAVDESIDQKPFVSIKTTSKPGPTPVLPASGSGSSQLVYRSGNTRIYENTQETATARPGPAGKDVDVKPYVRITTDKRYDTSPSISTSSGSANVVFNDGTTQVYEVGEVRSVGRYGPAGEEKDRKPYVELTTRKEYTSTPTVTGNTGSSNLVYDDGDTKVYEVQNVEAAAREGPAGSEKDSKPYVEITTDKRYSASPSISTTTGSSNIVFNDGETQVYEVSEVRSTAKFGPAGEEKDRKPYVELTTKKEYKGDPSVSGPTGASNLIYDDGTTKVFEVQNVEAKAREGTAGKDKDHKPYVKITTDKRYSTSPNIATTTGSANIVFNDGNTQVYEVSEISSAPVFGVAGEDKDKKPYVEITTTKEYKGDSTVSTDTGSSNLIYNDGDTKVYEVNSVRSAGRFGPAGEEKDKKVYVELTTRKEYSPSPTVTGNTGSSNLVFDDGQTKVWEINNIESTGRYQDAGEEKDKKPYLETTTKTRYADNPTVSTNIGSSNLIFNDGDTRVWEVKELIVSGRYREYGVEKDKRVGYTLETTKRYSDSNSVGTPLGTANLIYSDGQVDVYDISEITPRPDPVSFISEVAQTQIFKKTVTTEYKTAPTGSGTFQSGVVFTDGQVTIYKVDTTLTEAVGQIQYDSVAHATIPSTLRNIRITPVARKDNRAQNIVDVDVEEGYTGSFPARVTEFFTKDSNVAGAFVPMTFKPRAIHYTGITFNIGIGETLHGNIVVTESIGTQDPDFEAQSRTVTFAATEPMSIPTGWQPFAISVDPYEDGFLVKKIEIKYK